MIRNYFKIAWRNLRKNKGYAAINIIGLGLGLACGILIFLLISFQLSFDNFHKNSDRVYRIVTEFHAESVDYSPAVPQPIGKAFRNDFDFAEATAMVVDFRNTMITLPGGSDAKKFREERGLAYVEPAFFDILNFPLVSGDAQHALANPGSAIITQKLATKYFGQENPVGKRIKVDNESEYTVTGILKDIPPNTDRKQEIYVSYVNLKDKNTWMASDSSWGGVYSGCQAFTRLKPSVTRAQVEKAMPLISKKYYNERDAKEFQFKLQPLSDMHFNPKLNGPADKKYLWALFFVGIFLIITACVNFVNLATAQALNRSREVGIRKVLGGLKMQLFWQFIAETAVITLMAALLALGLAYFTLPFIGKLFRSDISMNLFSDYRFTLFLVALSAIVVFLAGSYPGMALARFQPVVALKSKLSQRHIGGISLRRILVVAQFAISQMLIIGVIVIASQIHYSRTTDLGFRKDNVVLLNVPSNDKVKMNTLRNELGRMSAVQNVSLCYQPPAAQSNNSTDIIYDTRTEAEAWSVNMKFADDKYLPAFNLQLVAGRNIFPSDTAMEFVVNETVAKKLNVKPQELIGKRLSVNGRSATGPIVGVVRDFYNYSMHEEIAPICIFSDVSRYDNCAVTLSGANTRSTMASVEKIWKSIYPEYFYDSRFYDERIAEFYRSDGVLLSLIQGFAGIAVLIGCLGLYGLVSFMAVRKTKEIGVRKVLGANVSSILWMFGREFSRLLLIAFVFAAPLAWWAMHQYLQDFKYRIDIGIGIFALAIGATFIIAAVTVGYRSLVAAMANPVRSLRSE